MLIGAKRPLSCEFPSFRFQIDYFEMFLAIRFLILVAKPLQFSNTFFGCFKLFSKFILVLLIFYWVNFDDLVSSFRGLFFWGLLFIFSDFGSELIYIFIIDLDNIREFHILFLFFLINNLLMIFDFIIDFLNPFIVVLHLLPPIFLQFLLCIIVGP